MPETTPSHATPRERGGRAGSEAPLAARAQWIALALILVLALVNAIGFCSSNQIEDDAFIFFRYVDNALAGHGLTWNPGGERVEGYSSFLFVLVMLAARAVGAEPVGAAHFLNLLFFLASVLLGAWVVRLLGGRSARLSWLAAGLIASSAQLATFARNGMETALFGALILVALGLDRRAPARPLPLALSGAAFALAGLTRPEGFLVYLVCAGERMWDRRSRGESLLDRAELTRLAFLLALVVPHLVFRLAYYRELLPNTYHAKVSWRPEVVSRGFVGLIAYLGSFRGALAAMAVILWALLPERRSARVLVLLLGAWVAYLTFALGLPHWWYWYAMPVDLFALLLLGWALGQHLASSSLQGRRVLVSAGCALLLLGNLSGAIQRHVTSREPFRLSLRDAPDRATVNQFITIGHELRRIVKPGESLAVGACGAIPYYAGIETIDVLGLNDKHIARTKVTGPITDAFGHEKGDGAYVLSKRPTYLVPLPILTPQPNNRPAGFEKSFNEIFQMPEFRRDYEFKNVEISKGQFFNYYERRRAPVPDPPPPSPPPPSPAP